MNQEWFPNWFSHVDENWFSHVDELTPAQRKEVTAALSDQRSGEASLAAIELGADDERRCPHYGSGGAVSRGKARATPIPLQGLRQDLRRTDGPAAVEPAS